MKRKLRRIKRKLKRLNLISIIVFVLIFIILVILLLSTIISNNNDKKILLEESNNIKENIKVGNINTDYLNKIYNKNIVSGKYKVVEESLEDYTKDYTDLINEITKSLQDTTYTNLLTSTNYQASISNNFSDNLTYISNKNIEFNNLESRLKEITTKSTYNKYINDKTKDIKSINLYDECILNIIDKEEISNLESSLKDANYILTISNDILNFLVTYKDKWHIENNNIVFSDNNLLTIYTDAINKIKDQ